MDPSMLLLLSLLTPWGPIEGDRDLVRPTKDLEWFQWAIHGNMICLDFEGYATAGGQAGAVELAGTEFPGVTLSAGPGTDGLFVGIPDPSLGGGDVSFYADHFVPVSGEAVLSPSLGGTPHGQIVIDFENPVLGVGAHFLDVEAPGTSIEVFDGPGGTGHSRGFLELEPGDTFAGLTTWYIHSAVLTLGNPPEGVGLDDLCFENPFQVKSQELFFEHLSDVTCIDFEGIAGQSGPGGFVQIAGDTFPGLTLTPGYGATGLYVFVPDGDYHGVEPSSGEAVLITKAPPETPNGTITVNFHEPVDGFGSYFTDVEDQVTQIELFEGPDAEGRSLGKVRWTNNEDGFVGIFGENAHSAKLWLGGYGDGVGLDDMCFGRLGPNGCRVDDFGDGTVASTWTLDALGDADVADAVEADGALELTGNGSELYHDTDHGAFLHRGATGDFRAELEIVAVDDAEGHEYRKGGLMVRESTDPSAPRIMVQYLPDFPDPSRPGPALQFDARLAPGGPFAAVASTVPGIALPVRVAVERRGDRFSVFYSIDDGRSWIHPLGGLGGEAVIPMAPDVRVGPAVASYEASNPFTVSFGRAELCEPDLSIPPTPDPPCPRDSETPLDWIYLMDVSSTMTASHGASPTAKRSSAAAAVLALHDAVTARADGGRVALVTYVGALDDPDFNLAYGAELVTGFTDELDDVRAGLDAMARADVFTQVITTTPSAIALRRVLELVLEEADPSRDVAVVWTTDNLPNIDDEGRGPGAYTDAELQLLRLRDAFGRFLPPSEVAVQGNFNALGTYDGEPVADAMDALLDLRAAHDRLRVFSLVPRNDGVSAPVYSEELLEFAAWATAGSVFGGASPEALGEQVPSLLGDAYCDGAACASDSFEGELGAAWTLTALGDADQASAATEAGALRLTGDGTSAYAGADHGAFLHQPVDGNFRLEVDVLGFPVDAGGPYRKAGLMVRAGLHEHAARVMVQYVPDFGGQGPALQFRARAVDGGPGDVALGSNLFGVALPVRLALEHRDGVYTVEFSTDHGATWRRPAGGSGGELALDLGPRPLAGLHAVSYDADTALTAELDRFVVDCDR